jgi:hypothetical protein
VSRLFAGIQALGIYPEPYARTEDGDKTVCMYMNLCSVDYLARAVAATWQVRTRIVTRGAEPVSDSPRVCVDVEDSQSPTVGSAFGAALD